MTFALRYLQWHFNPCQHNSSATLNPTEGIRGPPNSWLLTDWVGKSNSQNVNFPSYKCFTISTVCIWIFSNRRNQLSTKDSYKQTHKHRKKHECQPCQGYLYWKIFNSEDLSVFSLCCETFQSPIHDNLWLKILTKQYPISNLCPLVPGFFFSSWCKKSFRFQ